MATSRMIDEVVQAWQVNNRINLLLIRQISAAGMKASLSSRGGRTVARQFAHLHNNRIWQLQRRAKALAEGAHLFDTHDEPNRRALSRELRDSTARAGEWPEAA